MKKFMADEHVNMLKNAFLVLILIFLSSITIVASANNQSFSIVVLPDTQHYSECYPQIFTNQTQWIADNRDRLNVKFVIHEGDIVEDANNDTQWIRANESISVLDGKIPYGILPGNHDKNITEYEKYFPAKRYKNYSYWGGSYHNRVNYQLFSALGIDFIIVNLGWKPSSDEINLEIFVKTFSPYLNKYERDGDSEFKLEENPFQPDLLDIISWKLEKTFKMAIETENRLTSLIKISLLSPSPNPTSSLTCGLSPA